MIKLLAKFFIKDSNNYTDLKVRKDYGMLCGAVGISLNLLLFLGKLLFSIISHSVAMTADALNNLSDAATSIVSVAGFKLSQKPSDAEHPFGHGRIEYIAGLIVSFLIISMGLELFKSSINSLKNPNNSIFSISSCVILVIAILIKLYMAYYNTAIGKKISSVTLKAVAKDSISDIIGTLLVLISLIASLWTAFPVDAIAGLIVALFILRTGFESAFDTARPLIGTPPTHELVTQIKEELLLHPPIKAMHDLVVHDYGPGRLIISLHAEVPGHINIFTLHEVIDKAEVDISKRFNCITVIHMDPIDTENKELDHYKKIIEEKTHEFGKDFSVHDVRMVPGVEQTNLIFDLVVPFTSKISIDKVKDTLKHNIENACPKVQCVITAERSYC